MKVGIPGPLLLSNQYFTCFFHNPNETFFFQKKKAKDIYSNTVYIFSYGYCWLGLYSITVYVFSWGVSNLKR